MTDNPHHEPGDELLSAYLDDELSAEESALVERRLAVDADARQIVENLRNLSQSVRDLPRQAVGRDLREPILQRVEAARTSARSAIGSTAAAGILGSSCPAAAYTPPNRRERLWYSAIAP